MPRGAPRDVEGAFPPGALRRGQISAAPLLGHGGRARRHLLDELTGEPARGDGYPIRITEPAAVVAKLLPAMQAGVRAMAVFNGAAGVARCFGYPAPAVPEAWRAGAQSTVEILKQSSSVEHFGAVHGAVEDGGGERTFRGAALRDFRRLLVDEDPSKGFAGLRRLGDDDGTAVWTALTDQQVAGALEKRAAERRAERRRLEAFVLEKIEDDEDAIGAARGTGAAGARMLADSAS